MRYAYSFVFFASSFLLLGLAGCASATKQLSKRLHGTWNIANYGVERPEVRSLTGAAASGFGSITFNKDGSGSIDNASIFDNITSGNRAGQYNFRWSNTENIIVIRGEGSNVSKSWIVMANEKKKQMWKSTGGDNKVQTLELNR